MAIIFSFFKISYSLSLAPSELYVGRPAIISLQAIDFLGEGGGVCFSTTTARKLPKGQVPYSTKWNRICVAEITGNAEICIH